VPDPNAIVGEVFRFLATSRETPIHFALNGLLFAFRTSEAARATLIERGFVNACCGFLTVAPQLAADALKCLAAVVANGEDAAGAVTAVSRSGIIAAESGLFRLCAAFCALCVLRPAYSAEILEAEVLPKFCRVAEGGSFEERVLAFGVFEAAASSPELVAVITECGGVQAVAEAIEGADSEVLVLLLRLIGVMVQAKPGLWEAVRAAGVERVVAELVDDGEAPVAELAAAILRLVEAE
jgi:hypothetical protein